MEISSDSARHPTTALPMDSSETDQVYRDFNLVGYFAEVLIENGIIAPTEFLRINRGE